MQSNRFKTRANLGVGGGILAMLMGSGVAQQGPDFLLVGGAAALGGWALLICGCVNYVRWKGYSGWFGLFGYLLVPGLIILICFPNRRKRILQKYGSLHVAEMEAFSEEDRRSGYRFLLTLVPLGVLCVSLGGLLFYSRSNIDSAEWKQVAPAGIGFQALMPGTPRREQKTQDTPAGKVELHKFIVERKGKKELFMIVWVRFPDEVSNQLGGTDKLLELGRQDLLAACQGQVQSQRELILSGSPGLELEVLPPEGAIIKARIYATKNQIYQVSVHVPKIRLTSEDVQRFFDSFKLSGEPLHSLKFQNADWGTDDFTRVKRDDAGIYLSRAAHGQPGRRVWIGVEDVEALHEQYKALGARICSLKATRGYEMKVEHPDCHVLRFRSEPKSAFGLHYEGVPNGSGNHWIQFVVTDSKSINPKTPVWTDPNGTKYFVDGPQAQFKNPFMDTGLYKGAQFDANGANGDFLDVTGGKYASRFAEIYTFVGWFPAGDPGGQQKILNTCPNGVQWGNSIHDPPPQPLIPAPLYPPPNFTPGQYDFDYLWGSPDWPKQ